MTSAREYPVLREEFHDWLGETPPLVRLNLFDLSGDHPGIMPGASAMVLPGAYDEEGEAGATLYWDDGVVNDWAEWYSDQATAFARLAALVRCMEDRDGSTYFKDGGPSGFTRWSDNFFVQTTTRDPKPVGGGT